VEGPTGVNLVTAVSDTATESGAVGSYSAIEDTLNKWQDMLINWRCRLSLDERHRLGAPSGWNCRDVKFFVGRISFEQFDPPRAAALNAIETNFHLPPDQIELLINSGREALKNSLVFRSFLGSLPTSPPRGKPVASPADGPQEALAQ